MYTPHKTAGSGQKSTYTPAKTTAPAQPKTVVWDPQQLANLGNAWAALPGNAGKTVPGPVPSSVQQTPGNPGTKTPPVPPYMTGQDIVNYGDAFKGKGDQIAQADKDLGDVKAWAQTAIYNIGRNYLQGTDNTQNDAAGRGIFQSSIKDGALADLAATKATMSSDVNTRLNNAQVFHDSAVKRISDWFDNFTEGMNNIKVENGAAAGANAPPYVAGQEPTAAKFAPVTPAAPANPWVAAWLKKNPGRTWPS